MLEREKNPYYIMYISKTVKEILLLLKNEDYTTVLIDTYDLIYNYIDTYDFIYHYIDKYDLIYQVCMCRKAEVFFWNSSSCMCSCICGFLTYNYHDNTILS